MKTKLILAGILFALAGGYLLTSHLSGGRLFSFGIPVGGERAELIRMTHSFWEDVQFKDFKRAASYHAPDKRDKVDIPFLLWRVFVLKPEMLEVMEYENLFVDIDSTRLRARVKTHLKVKDLVRDRIKEQDVLIYYHRAAEGEPWYMELENSLRQIQAEKGKKK